MELPHQDRRNQGDLWRNPSPMYVDDNPVPQEPADTPVPPASDPAALRRDIDAAWDTHAGVAATDGDAAEHAATSAPRDHMDIGHVLVAPGTGDDPMPPASVPAAAGGEELAQGMDSADGEEGGGEPNRTRRIVRRAQNADEHALRLIQSSL